MIKKIATYMCVAAVLLFSAGCATAHRKLTAQTAVLGPPFYNSHGELVRNWEVPGAKPGTTAQLTPVGCALHTLATGGHVAWECRSVAATRGRWIWRKQK